MSVDYMDAVKEMVKYYQKWDKACDHTETSAKVHGTDSKWTARAQMREDKYFAMLRAQTRLVGELFGKSSDEVFDDVCDEYFKKGGVYDQSRKDVE